MNPATAMQGAGFPAAHAVYNLRLAYERQSQYIRDDRREQRDRIALMVLPTILADYQDRLSEPHTEAEAGDHERLVARAYQIADTMLAATESQVPSFVQEGPA